MVATTGTRSSASRRTNSSGSTSGDVAHEAEIGVAGGAPDEAGVLAGNTDRQRPVDVDGGHDVPVDLAHQHHAGDVEGLGVGDPQAVAELGLLAQAGHELADLGTPPWTTTACMPTERIRTMSVAKLGQRPTPPPKALPPYLTTTDLPQNRRM